jgi:plasmid replication initiation protein
MFARINLLIERRFKKTKYALPLYELGLDYRDNKDKVSGKGCTPWLSVDQLRKYLGVADKYPEFKLLNRAILQNALKEVAAEADITMTLEKRVDKRVVTHVRFLIEDDPTHMSAREKIRRTMATLPGMGTKNQDEVLKFAQAMHAAFGVSLPRARKIARLYIGHEPELRAVMEKIQHDKLAGKVKGKLGAYAAAVLEEENPVVKIKKIPHIE